MQQYKFYATLLDAFEWYLGSEQPTAEQDFIDKINRKPFQSDAAEKGTAFNDVMDIVLTQQHPGEDDKIVTELVKKHKFNYDLIYDLAIHLHGSVPQFFCKRELHTSKGSIEIYGYMDYIKYKKAIDLKTTKTYTLGKYANSWQKIVYPWCLAGEGIFVDEFEFLVTDFEHIYREPYPVQIDNNAGQLTEICERLIDFIEAKRMFITDKKIFGGENNTTTKRTGLLV